ncbi:actin, putative, partial [Entamoeba invadens IP1]
IFDMSVLGSKETKPIQEKIVESINKCPEEMRNELYGNIIFSGGNTLFKGYVERLKKELQLLAPEGTNVNIIAQENRAFGAFWGSVVYANQSTTTFVSKQEYEEKGILVFNF